jgi:hypothetical protein
MTITTSANHYTQRKGPRHSKHHDKTPNDNDGDWDDANAELLLRHIIIW